MLVYHGGKHTVHAIDPERLGSDGELLCASASTSVAMRYGPVITIFELLQAPIKRMSLQEWFSNTVSTATLRQQGFAGVIVGGEPDSYDFPVDTLFVLNPDIVRFVGKLAKDAPDDGLPKQHEPSGPDDPYWRLYVESVYGGDENAALDAFNFDSRPCPAI